MIVTVTLAPALDRTAAVNRLDLDVPLRPLATQSLPGGKGLNVSRALVHLGDRTVATGLAGGPTGAWLVAAAAAEGLHPCFVDTAAETRMTYVVWDSAGRSVLVYETPPCSDPADLQRLQRRLETLLPDAAFTVLAGSLPPGLPDESLGSLARASRAAGVPVLVDSSGLGLARALESGPDLVKVAFDEAVEVCGDPPQALDALDAAAALARQLVGRGAGTAVVTHGAVGAAACDGSADWRVTVPQVRAVNPVGAGDAFTAGLVSALTRQAPLGEALRRAAAAGTACALQTGAGQLDPTDFTRLVAGVTVTRHRSDRATCSIS